MEYLGPPDRSLKPPSRDGQGRYSWLVFLLVVIATIVTYFSLEKGIIYYIFHSSFPNRSPMAQAANTAEPDIYLCGKGVKHNIGVLLERTATIQLSSYLDGLKQGKYVFNYNIDGSEAAKQLGFDARFAATYNEISDTIKSNELITFSAVLANMENILNKEKLLDSWIERNQLNLASILYLRSFQSSQCAFPNIFQSNLSADDVFDQLKEAYPDINIDAGRPMFHNVYYKTVAMIRELADRKGTYSAFQTIQYMRDAILKNSS